MAEPVSIAVGVAKAVGPRIAKEVIRWARGSEAKQLVKLLETDYPTARHLLVQPDALGELWLYAETGKFDAQAMRAAVRPVVSSDAEADRLAEAIRDTRWRVMRDERRIHFEFLRLREEVKSDIEASAILARIEAALGDLRAKLPAARQLPAQTAPFVDRVQEIAAGERALEIIPGVHGAVVVCCCGMPGVGKSALALELAHRRAERFIGGWLYVDMRTSTGEDRAAADAAARLLIDLGVAPEAIPQAPEARLASLRAVLSEEPVLMVLDNASDEGQVRDLIPAHTDSVVVVTAQASLAGLGAAHMIELHEMQDGDARAMLEALIGDRVVAEPDAVKELIGRAEGLPLALAVIGGRARRRPHEPLATLVGMMSMMPDEVAAIDDPSSTLHAALASAIDELAPAARRLLLLMCGLQIADPTPESAAVVGDIDLGSAARLLEELGDQRVLTPRAGGGWRVHQLLRSVAGKFAREELGEELASAQQRRVKWLADSARARSGDLEGEV